MIEIRPTGINKVVVINQASVQVGLNAGLSRKVSLSQTTGKTVVVKSAYSTSSSGTVRLAVSTSSESLQKQNISVVALEEEDIVNHNLGTTKLSVSFFDTNNRELKNIDWEPVNESSIKIYLPFSDTPVVDTFTGDIFLIKRQ